MKVLLIATGYLPYAFSENLCNGRLVKALLQAGIEVDVISRKDEGPTYSTSWDGPWKELQANTHEIEYCCGGKVFQILDTLRACFELGVCLPIAGIRWGRYALQKALSLHAEKQYDAVLTRSPSDIPHIVGRAFARKTGVKWLANWNDPTLTTWPDCYRHQVHPMYAWKYDSIINSCMEKADVNTFPSPHLRDHYKKRYKSLTELNTEVIPHVQMPGYKPAQRIASSEKCLRMCHSGNMSAERNPETLFKAMRLAMDATGQVIHLDIMGVSNPLTQQLIEKYELSNYVHCIGSFPYLKSLEKLLEYDVLVLLEAVLKKGIFFASKLADYAQANRPILAVSPQVGYAADMLRETRAGIAVDNESPEAIAKALENLLTSKQNNSLDSDFAVAQLSRRYSPDVVAGIYVKLLRK